MENLYKVFGVSDFASEEELKKAYREKIKIYHPDNIETGNIEKFRELDEQYKILTNPETKEEHDSRLRFEQRMNDLRNASSKDFHFNDSYDEERVKAKEAQFESEYYNSSSQNWGSTYYDENFMKNMAGFDFNMDEQNELKSQSNKLKKDIQKREEFIRSSVVNNNLYVTSINECRDSLDLIRVQLFDLKKRELDKKNELVSLHNRKMYQMFPSRFESVENILKSELNHLYLEKGKLEVQLKVKESVLEGLRKREFDYKTENVENDIELIQLKSNLKKIELQINNPDTYTENIGQMQDKLCKLQCLIAKRKIEVQKESEENNPYPGKMQDAGETIVELELEKEMLEHELHIKSQESLNLRNNTIKNISNPMKVQIQVNELADTIQNLQFRLNEVSAKREEKQKEYNVFNINCSQNKYLEECLERDSELINLRLQLEEIQQQINNLISYPHRKR